MAGRLKKGCFCVALGCIVFLSTAGIAFSAIERLMCVPWQGDPQKPHTALSGTPATLKCVVKATDKTAIYVKWIFGDGTESSISTLSGSTKYNVEAGHTYTGATGAPFSARILADTAISMESPVSNDYLLRIEDSTLDSKVNVAIDSGLWWLYKNANTDPYYKNGSLHTFNSTPFMVWHQGPPYGTYFASPTASAIQAFGINNHKITGNSNEDPYVEAVQLGMNWLIQGYYLNTGYPMLRAVSVGIQHAVDDPEAGQASPNHYGIEARDCGSRAVYQGGMVMDAIVACGVRPGDSTGRDFKARGSAWTYKELLQDMCDMYAQGQYDGVRSTYGILGSWRYGWGDACDNSASQWAAIGMIAAQQPPWSCLVPDWVKAYNANWLKYSYSSGHFGYLASNDGYDRSFSTTPSGMVQMSFVGQVGYDDPTTQQDERDAKWIASERYLADNWHALLHSQSCWKGNLTYGWYAFSKAMRLAAPSSVARIKQTNGARFDWYYGDSTHQGLAQRIIELQQPDGHWEGNLTQNPLTTAWMIITLKPSLFAASPVSCFSAHPNPGYADQPISFDPSCSGHSQTGKDIQNLVSFEWDWNDDGIHDETASAPERISHPFSCASLPCTHPVTLKVTDDSNPALSATYRVDVKISNPPHPPVSNAGGPYRVSLCSRDSLRLDGSKSFDPDEGEHETGCATCPNDTITSWSWDLKAPLTDFQDKAGKSVVISSGNSQGELQSYFGPSGPRTIGLRVFDNTKLAYPGSGEDDLADVNFGSVQVDECCVPDLSLKTEPTGRGKVRLEWSLTGASSYDILRSTDGANTGFRLLKDNCLPEDMPYIDSSGDLTLGILYTYRIVTSDGCGSAPSVATPQCSIKDLSLVSRPGRKALLSWSASCDEKGSCAQSYSVCRSLADPPNPKTDSIASVVIPSYLDSDLSSGVTYYYQVVSSDGCPSNVVSVMGNTSPVANAGEDRIVEQTDAAGTLANLDGSGSSDPDQDTLAFSWSTPLGTLTGVSPVVSLPLGTNTITLTVFDGSLESTDSVSITVKDTSPPSIDDPADIEAEQEERSGTSISLEAPEVTDTCDANPLLSNDAPAIFPLGETIVTWKAADASGNSQTATQKVSIVDTTPPSISDPSDVKAEQEDRSGTHLSLEAPEVTDICDSNPLLSSDAPAVFPPGETIVTWTARDASGNTAKASQKVMVADTTPPAISAPADIKIEQANRNGTYVFPGSPVVFDACDAGPRVLNDAPAIFPLGETLIAWTAVDASGNSKTAIQKVSVVDTTPPKIIAPSDIFVEQAGPNGGYVSTPSPMVFDICDAGPAITSDAPAVFPPGVTIITWRAVDASGNVSTASQKVALKDSTPPRIIAPPDITTEQADLNGTAVSTGAPSVQDICDPHPAITSDAPCGLSPRADHRHLEGERRLGKQRHCHAKNYGHGFHSSLDHRPARYGSREGKRSWKSDRSRRSYRFRYLRYRPAHFKRCSLPFFSR